LNILLELLLKQLKKNCLFETLSRRSLSGAPQKNCVKNLNGVEEKKKNMSEPRIKNNNNRSGASLFFFPKRSEDLAIILQCMFLFVLFLR
jgi:hypothetical protein